MKTRSTFFYLTLFATFAVQAQNVVPFKMQPNGTYLTEDGKDYQIVEFEGKTAPELYDMVILNAKQLFCDAKDIIRGNEPFNISINAKFDVPKEALGPFYTETVIVFESRVDYVLSFKDGRIKIEAPKIDENLHAVFDFNMVSDFRLVRIIGDSFNRKGVVKPKFAESIRKFEANVNGHIEALLGIQKDEDW